jgi:phospholipid/cholesterol/gamma-HCH transport system substrate-binding protein
MKSVLQMPEFKVGLLVLVVAGLIAVMSMRVSEDPTVGGAKKYWFLTPNASGLVKKSAVKMAGIPIGVIKDIRLEDGIARVDMVVRDVVDLRQSARVEIKANGILGDKYVEISPGSPEDPPLASGEQIVNVNDKASMDGLLSQVSEIGSSLKTVAVTLKEAVADQGSDKHILGRIVQNIDRLTGDLANITSENKDRVNDILAEINSVTRTLSTVLNNGDNGVKQTWARLDRVLKNVEEVTAKINQGQGTIGKLINDEKTVEEINAAVEGINNLLDASNKLQTSIDFHSEYMGSQDIWRSFLGVKVQPGLDRYYLVQVIDDPTGLRERSKTETQSNPGSSLTVDETRTSYNKMKLSLLFAKNFYDFTIRGGLMENAGGVGVDYHFWRNRLRLTAEAFQFSSVNLRYSLTYTMFKGFYVTGGVHDALNNNNLNSSFVGAGLFLTNDDMKFLLNRVNF